MNLSVKQTHHQCWQLLQKQQFRQALPLAQALVQHRRDSAEAWYTLSYTLSAVKALEQANEAIDKAIELEANNPEFLIHKAKCHLSLNALSEALALAEQSLPLAGDNPELLTKISAIYHYCDEFEQYLKVTEKVACLCPNSISALANYADALKFVGEYSAADKAIEKVLSIAPNDAKAHYNRSQLRRVSTDDNHIKRMEDVLTRTTDWRDQMMLAFALGKECEDLHQYESSFAYTQQGNQLRKQHSSYDVTSDINTLDQIRATYHQKSLRAMSAGYQSDEPIFVLGLPRTGTTLVERILGSHTDIFDAGELRNFSAEMVKQITKNNQGEALSKTEMVEKSLTIDWHELGEQYINSTRPRTGHTAKFVDKMPLNYLYLGLIKQALPKAKIIILQRNPMDACYAMYKALFGHAYPFTYSLEDLGHYYVAWKALMDHWIATFGGQLFVLNYEDLVNNTEQKVRELIEYCELPWQPGCLNFHEKSSGVSTASASQVRQPIYKSSIGKWANYQEQLTPLSNILVNAGIELPRTR